jgi:hypothetical protein
MMQSRFKKQVGVTKLCRMILCQPWVCCDVELCRDCILPFLVLVIVYDSWLTHVPCLLWL